MAGKVKPIEQEPKMKNNKASLIPAKRKSVKTMMFRSILRSLMDSLCNIKISNANKKNMLKETTSILTRKIFAGLNDTNERVAARNRIVQQLHR
ncbi:hypothetical protein Dsin_002415 [Dipteronia sinensis]|uniref:Ribosomal protein S7 n=1 Tax=Dipteronia sinensis TaxID=43782 RepID=A0AAE0B732_9ROSI|nr:hypothetical protein Dsin_002415 [Dipteronia sinensis]